MLVSSLAAAAAGATAMLIYHKWKDYQKYRIPSELLNSPYARELRLAARVAWKGQKIKGHIFHVIF